jgi:uncharacterized membrane protein
MNFKDMPKLPLVLIALMFVVGVVVYPSLPSQIPMHWGVTGAVDRWADKSLGSVFFAPLMTLGIYVLLWLVPYLDPQRRNVLRSRQVYALTIELMGGLGVVLFAGTLLASFDHSLPMWRLIEVAVGVMFVVLGNYMGRVKRNWTIGFRYGWTLSDDVVWAKTNRLGGRLLLATGVIAIVAALAPPTVGFVLLMVPLLITLPVTYVYSMRLYRERHPGEMRPPRQTVLDGDTPTAEPGSGELNA